MGQIVILISPKRKVRLGFMYLASVTRFKITFSSQPRCRNEFQQELKAFRCYWIKKNTHKILRFSECKNCMRFLRSTCIYNVELVLEYVILNKKIFLLLVII